MKVISKKTGELAEQHACAYLEKQGMRLVDKNYHCYFGEIDLIMRDSDDIVFVEVRYRTSIDYGTPIETIQLAKQRKLIKTAMHYLHKNNYFDKVDCRFDVVGISQNKIDWIKNAFSAEPLDL